MAITLATAARNAAADAVCALCNGGTLEFQTSGGVAVATCSFAATAFGAATAGVATAAAIGSDTNAAGGTIAKFVAKDSGGAQVFSGSVTAAGSGGDFTVPSTGSLMLGAGDTFSVSSFTYTQP